MTKVFIDGSEGTTGLRIQERLEGRSDLTLLHIPGELRKDTAARKELLENQVFQWDCAAFGFPDDMVIYESDSPDVFDIDVFWRNEN